MLDFINKWSDSLEPEEFDVEEFEIPSIRNIYENTVHIKLLSDLYRSKPNIAHDALNLSFDLIFIQPSKAPEIIEVINDKFSFKRIDKEYDFEFQNRFIDFFYLQII